MLWLSLIYTWQKDPFDPNVILHWSSAVGTKPGGYRVVVVLIVVLIVVVVESFDSSSLLKVNLTVSNILVGWVVTERWA